MEYGGSRMETWMCNRAVNVRAARRLLPLLGIGLLAIGSVFASRGSTPRPLEALDPTFMKAVSASVSQHDVKAILAYQRSSAPVHLRLQTSCDEEQRCTIFTTMDYPHSELHALTVSLRVAVDVIHDRERPHKMIASSWQVRLIDPAVNKRAAYAGDFRDMKGVPQIGDNDAIARLLTAIQLAIGEVLRANGAIVKPITSARGPKTGAARSL